MIRPIAPPFEAAIDARAAAEKIGLLARELAAICEAYGLDVPDGCDDGIPLLLSEMRPPSTPAPEEEPLG